MSYLDDPDHSWQLDQPGQLLSLEEMIGEIASRDWDGLKLILQGYAGLKARHPEASDELCLDTSMTWYYG